jgi:hypothetical protein
MGVLEECDGVPWPRVGGTGAQLVALGDPGERLEVTRGQRLGVTEGHALIAVTEQLHDPEQAHAAVHERGGVGVPLMPISILAP